MDCGPSLAACYNQSQTSSSVVCLGHVTPREPRTGCTQQVGILKGDALAFLKTVMKLENTFEFEGVFRTRNR